MAVCMIYGTVDLDGSVGVDTFGTVKMRWAGEHLSIPRCRPTTCDIHITFDVFYKFHFRKK